MILKCDECENKFDLNAINTQTFERLKDDIEHHYFECPNCNKQYTTHYLNNRMKELQEEIKMLKYKSDLKTKQKNKLAKLRQKIIYEHDQLKKAVENDGKETT